MVKTALERPQLYRKLLKGKRLGLLTNPSGCDSHLRSSVEILAENFDLRALFGPEHGVNGDIQAGEIVEDRVNVRYGIPEYSLFSSGGMEGGVKRGIDPEHLKKIDLLIYDIQDIGSRFFTYIYSLANSMADCAAAGIPLAIFDRPNPVGGVALEGTRLREDRFTSFVGRYGMPARYGMTVGEFARFVNEYAHIGCDLTVIPCSGWRRAMLFPDYASVNWMNPSPNLPTFEATLIYNGSCFFEGTNISEGRGTTRPYEIVGAPYIDAFRLARRMNELKLPGVIFRETHFVPTWHKYKDELCHGVQFHLTDLRAFNGFETGVRLYYAIREMFPEFEVIRPKQLDNLFGDDALRLGGEPLEALLARGRAESEAFRRETAQYLLYRR